MNKLYFILFYTISLILVSYFTTAVLMTRVKAVCNINFKELNVRYEKINSHIDIEKNNFELEKINDINHSN